MSRRQALDWIGFFVLCAGLLILAAYFSAVLFESVGNGYGPGCVVQSDCIMATPIVEVTVSGP